MFRIVIFFLALGAGINVSANPLDRMQQVGQSSMHWMLWKLYDIALYSADGQYQPGSRPLALSITYAREIHAQKLVDATIDQWDRLSVPYSSQWVSQLKTIWPSVKPGDRITYVTDQDNNNRFYFNGQLSGEFSDAGFSAAFLAIWLSQDTREPDMRRALIGASNA